VITTDLNVSICFKRLIILVIGFSKKYFFYLFLLVGVCFYILNLSSSHAKGLMYTDKVDPHCEMWSLTRILGQKSDCRRRAVKQSKGVITCRLKSWHLNKDDETMRMCVYQRAGANMEDETMAMEELGVCAREFSCKRQ
jgi:hypothetical protein